MFIDLCPALEELVDTTDGEDKARAWLALTLYVVLASGVELTDRGAADRRLRDVLAAIDGEP